MGIAICYEAEIPEVSTTLTAMGAEVLLVPSSTFNVPRAASTSTRPSTLRMPPVICRPLVSAVRLPVLEARVKAPVLARVTSPDAGLLSQESAPSQIRR